MILKKIIIGIFSFSFLSACVQNVALLGPAYTLAASGSVYQAGITYGGNEVVTKTTGKSVAQNFKAILILNEDDTEFEKLVKENIKKTRKKLERSNR